MGEIDQNCNIVLTFSLLYCAPQYSTIEREENQRLSNLKLKTNKTTEEDNIVVCPNDRSTSSSSSPFFPPLFCPFSFQGEPSTGGIKIPPPTTRKTSRSIARNFTLGVFIKTFSCVAYRWPIKQTVGHRRRVETWPRFELATTTPARFTRIDQPAAIRSYSVYLSRFIVSRSTTPPKQTHTPAGFQLSAG